MEDYRLNQSGQEVQEILDDAAKQSDLTAETDRAELAEQTLQGNIDIEERDRQAADVTLQGNIDAEELRAKAAEKQNADDIDALEEKVPSGASSSNKMATASDINTLDAAIQAILLLIPSAATSLNQLADKAFVNSSIATASATFRGTYNLVSDLSLTTSATHAQIASALAGAVTGEDNNDYAFVQIPTSDATPTEIAKTERYKFNGTAWEYEYDLNNSGYTADQWAAINSGITQALVTKLSALPTNADLTTALGVLTDGIAAINGKIPSSASSSNKLVDSAAMVAYIGQIIDAIDATFNVTSTDGHVTVQITQVNGVITAVNVTTSDIASDADLSLLAGRVTTAEGNISTNAQDIAALQAAYGALTQSAPQVIEPTDTWPVANPSTTVIYRVVDRVNTPPQYYTDYMWNGTTMVQMAQYDNAIDPRPKKGSQNLVTSGGVFDNMGALDISELNATENPHTLATYADLSAAIAAIPSDDYKKGGMSVKFVQSSDNKYVQFRFLLSGSFTAAQFANTDNWAICDDGVYIKNPEFVYIKADDDGKILIGIKNDGDIYFGAGVPQQVKDYIQKKIEELSLDEYENIVSFLGTLINEDKTLQQLLNEKVDKVEGKSLIDSEYATNMPTIQKIVGCPEWMHVITDDEGKILEGRRTDGTKVENMPQEFPACIISNKNNPQWVKVLVDNDGKILEGIDKDGNKVLFNSLLVHGNIESPTIDGLNQKNYTSKTVYPLLSGYYETDGTTFVSNVNYRSCVVDNAENSLFALYGKGIYRDLWITLDIDNNIVRRSGSVEVFENDPLYLKTQFNEVKVIFCCGGEIGSISRLYYDNTIPILFAATHSIISEINKDSIAHCPCLYYDYYKNDGTVYLTYFKDESGVTVEQITNKTSYDIFCVANIYDVAGTIQRYDLMKANQTVGNYTQGDVPPYDPDLLVFEDYVLVTFCGGTAIHGTFGIFARKFIKETSSWEDVIYPLTISDGSNTYNISTAELPDFFEQHGIPDVSMNTVICFSERFVYNSNDGYYYHTIVGGFSNTPIIIAKTLDGISYEFVTIAPTTMRGVEAWIEIVEDYIILIERDQNYKCKLNRYDMVNDIWSNEIILHNSFYARPSMCVLNGELYIFYNSIPHLKTDWGQTTRTSVVVEKLNPYTMERTFVTVLTSNYGINYIFPTPIKGSLYAVYAEDVRQLNIGEVCSNIAISKLI